MAGEHQNLNNRQKTQPVGFGYNFSAKLFLFVFVFSSRVIGSWYKRAHKS